MSAFPGQTTYVTSPSTLSSATRTEKKANLVFFLIVLFISLVIYFIIQWLSTRQCTDPEKDKDCIRLWGIIPPGIVTWTVSACFGYVLFVWLLTYFYLSKIRYESS
jgi:hypothetical protein